ncbi:MAG: glucosaminidase domain-containing protein [Bacteroidia bacterium]|nr:glucosaminidase domain-containing protein [Bacteroidia bacterium]
MRLFLKYWFLAISVLFSGFITAQPAEYKLTADEYVEKYKEDAVKEMLLHGVPASITLAQGMLESGNGNSALAVYANNHFGIKCHAEWTGATFIQDDDATNECFRKYNSVLESYGDHSLFLKTRPRYSFLFDLQITDYKGWANGLKSAGYATDPNYAYRLIEIIEKHNLNDLDKMTMVPVEKKDNGKKVKNVPRVTSKTHLTVKLNNGRKYVIAREGDTYSKIAGEFDLGTNLIYKYNDRGLDDALKKGEIVYIQPKKKKSEKQKVHIVKSGETLHGISQKYGIKLKYLYKWNGFDANSSVKPGDSVKLRK